MSVFSLCIVSVVCFQNDDGIVISIYVGIIILSSAYYVFVVKDRQFFSKEENLLMFNAYLINANTRKLRSPNKKMFGSIQSMNDRQKLSGDHQRRDLMKRQVVNHISIEKLGVISRMTISRELPFFDVPPLDDDEPFGCEGVLPS